jgi:ABC-type sugar transport system ATPase subunit
MASVKSGEALRVEGISKTFGVVRALKEVTLSFEKGEIHALLGENGAGKSTLAKILGGAQPPDTGRLIVDGKETSLSSPSAALHEGISVVYQHLNLAEELTVAENLFLGREPRGPLGLISEREMNRRAQEQLDRLGASFRADSLVRNLSTSDRQLAEICRALSHNPSFLIMDEPTASLSAQATERMFEVIRGLRDEGVCILYITHELSHVFQHADRITVLKDGDWVETIPVSATDHDRVIESMVGRKVEALFPDHAATVNSEVAPMLEVEGLTLPGYFEDISFSIRPGEILGFGGLVGSGRTRLARAIFGVLPEKRQGGLSGRIAVGGRDVKIPNPRVAVAHGLGLVPDDRSLDGLVADLPVAGNLSLPQLSEVSRLGVLDSGAEGELAREQIESLRIKAASPAIEVSHLSGGNQQKVVLGKWMAMGCKVLILDEPTPGVDIGAKADIYALVRRAADEGAAIMLISSDLPELMGLSDRIMVMSRGRIVAELDHEEATEERIMNAAFAGLTGGPAR